MWKKDVVKKWCKNSDGVGWQIRCSLKELIFTLIKVLIAVKLLQCFAIRNGCIRNVLKYLAFWVLSFVLKDPEQAVRFLF